MAIGDVHTGEYVTLAGRELEQWRAAKGLAEALRDLERGVRLWISVDVSDDNMKAARAVLAKVEKG